MAKSVSLGGVADLSHINWQDGNIDTRETLKVDRVPAFTLQKLRCETKTYTHIFPCTRTPGRVEMLQESPDGPAATVVPQQHQACSLIHTTT